MLLTSFIYTDRLGMEAKATSCEIVLEVLDKNNYMSWSVRMKTYLTAHDLWDAIEIETESPEEEDEATLRALSKKNFMALYVIKNSCGPESFYEIMED
ncbi:hypothetical protein CJ030_MR4G009214 [Morella rubra]|uniref:DUF4219 domain-containing protein n=1 Tax=Morella rubra TaxID=262757 RepID=A0A6A1VRY7_9ROSI|nr:hypothetical protein CJ030_MR4G009214 [Morella rubra]